MATEHSLLDIRLADVWKQNGMPMSIPVKVRPVGSADNWTNHSDTTIGSFDGNLEITAQPASDQSECAHVFLKCNMNAKLYEQDVDALVTVKYSFTGLYSDAHYTAGGNGEGMIGVVRDYPEPTLDTVAHFAVTDGTLECIMSPEIVDTGSSTFYTKHKGSIEPIYLGSIVWPNSPCDIYLDGYVELIVDRIVATQNQRSAIMYFATAAGNISDGVTIYRCSPQDDFASPDNPDAPDVVTHASRMRIFIYNNSNSPPNEYDAYIFEDGGWHKHFAYIFDGS